jgi:hypothetical protein
METKKETHIQINANKSTIDNPKEPLKATKKNVVQ